MATKVQCGQEPYTCSNIIVGAAIFTDTALLAIGIIAIIGLLYPACPVAALGNTLTIQGALGTLIAGAVLLTALSLRPCCFTTGRDIDAEVEAKNTISQPAPGAQPVSTVKIDAPKKFYAIMGGRFDPQIFIKFLKIFSNKSGIQFEKALEMQNGQVTDPGPGNVILFDYWGRSGGEFSNPLPSNTKASIFYVVVSPTQTNNVKKGYVQLVYDPSSLLEKIDGIGELKNVIEHQSLFA